MSKATTPLQLHIKNVVFPQLEIHYKSIPAMAVALGAFSAAVYKWRAEGVIPYAHAISIERHTEGRFRAIDITPVNRECGINKDLEAETRKRNKEFEA